MSARRRRIKERVERDRRRADQFWRTSHSLAVMKRAIENAISRGEKKVTARLRRELNRHLFPIASMKPAKYSAADQRKHYEADKNFPTLEQLDAIKPVKWPRGKKP